MVVLLIAKRLQQGMVVTNHPQLQRMMLITLNIVCISFSRISKAFGVLQSQSGPYASRARFHHHPFWTRYQLSFPPLPCPAPQTPSSPIASVSTCLSVPSHSRPTRRQSRSMRPGRGFTGEGGRFGTSSSSSLSGSRSPGYKQHPA